MLQAGGRAWVVGVVGLAAGILLILTEFSRISYVTTITATCSDFADAEVRDSCLTMGHESHAWGLALLGLFVILMAFGAAAGGSRPAAVALLVAGVAGLAITLLRDLPRTDDKGAVGVAFAEGKAHKGAGFWFELVGSSLAIASGAFATWRTPPPRRERARRAAPPPDPDDRTEPEPEPPDAPEPASA
jgi:hypothetical protein